MPTTWHLGKQCVELATVPDEGFASIQGILGMPLGRREGHALTTSEVLNFTWWLPYRTREEFAQYRVEHLELELFPPYNFEALEQAHDKEAVKEVVLHRDVRFTWSTRGIHDSF